MGNRIEKYSALKNFMYVAYRIFNTNSQCSCTCINLFDVTIAFCESSVELFVNPVLEFCYCIIIII